MLRLCVASLFYNPPNILSFEHNLSKPEQLSIPDGIYDIVPGERGMWEGSLKQGGVKRSGPAFSFLFSF